jgi:hypothetical protein
MKAIYPVIISFLCIATWGCNNSQKKINTPSDTTIKKNQVVRYFDEDVSLINVIATPEKYKGRKIRVIGYLNLEFEGNGIYLHKDDYENGIAKNGLWVEMSRDSIQLPQIKKCIENYVLIEGTFDLSKGHMGAFSGSIKNITRLEIWHSDNNVRPPLKTHMVQFPTHRRKG